VLDEIRSHLDDPKGADDDGDNHGTYGDNDGQLPLSKGKKASKYPTPIYKYERLPITERSPSLSLTRFTHTQAIRIADQAGAHPRVARLSYQPRAPRRHSAGGVCCGHALPSPRTRPGTSLRCANPSLSRLTSLTLHAIAHSRTRRPGSA
jgi:hypothetical protein